MATQTLKGSTSEEKQSPHLSTGTNFKTQNVVKLFDLDATDWSTTWDQVAAERSRKHWLGHSIRAEQRTSRDIPILPLETLCDCCEETDRERRVH